MNPVHKFLRLSSRHQHLLLKTYFLLLGVRLGLWLLPFNTLRKLLTFLGQSSTKTIDSPENVQWRSLRQAIWAVEASSKRMPGGVKCLARALTTKVLLDRRGCPSELKIGVTKNDTGQLEAHAWVEAQGQVVIGQLSNLQEYIPLPSLPTV